MHTINNILKYILLTLVIILNGCLEKPSEIEDLLPAVPLLLSPNDGATGVTIPVTLSWQPSYNATSYDLQVSTSSGFGSLQYYRGNITATSHSVSGLGENTIYYWRVRAFSNEGNSSFSAVRSFKTKF